MPTSSFSSKWSNGHVPLFSEDFGIWLTTFLFWMFYHHQAWHQLSTPGISKALALPWPPFLQGAAFSEHFPIHSRLCPKPSHYTSYLFQAERLVTNNRNQSSLLKQMNDSIEIYLLVYRMTGKTNAMLENIRRARECGQLRTLLDFWSWVPRSPPLLMLLHPHHHATGVLALPSYLLQVIASFLFSWDYLKWEEYGILGSQNWQSPILFIWLATLRPHLYPSSHNHLSK